MTSHLPVGSACIDAGSAIDAPSDYDIDGDLRPGGATLLYDIGADEYGP